MQNRALLDRSSSLHREQEACLFSCGEYVHTTCQQPLFLCQVRHEVACRVESLHGNLKRSVVEYVHITFLRIKPSNCESMIEMCFSHDV